MTPAEILEKIGVLNAIILVVCLSLILLSCIIGFCLYMKLKGTKVGVVKIGKCNNVSWDMMSFIASFFFPVVSFNLTEHSTHALVLLLLYIMIGRIFVLSDKYCTNPTLLLLGFYVFEVESKETDQETEKVHKVTLITRDKLDDGYSYTYIKIDDKTYYAKRIYE